MRKIVNGSLGCITNTGEHQVEIDPIDGISEDNDIFCIICGDILWEPGMDHALLDELSYQMGNR